MAQAGAFEGVPGGRGIAGMTYVALTGAEPPVRISEIEPKQQTLDALATATRASLEGMLARFADPAAVYRAKTHVQELRYPTPYDHLSRYAEWSVANGADS